MAFLSATGVEPLRPTTYQVSIPLQLYRRQTKGSKKTKPMSSSERGVKFRRRQQEREVTLVADTMTLQREVARLMALRDVYKGRSLLASNAGNAAPMKFILEYFKQFRIGLRVPGAPATVLSSETQRNFLNSWIEPQTKFGDKPAVDTILGVWENYSRLHTSVNLVLESAEVVTTDASSSVVVHGILKLRYSRRTIQNVFPNAIAEEELVQKLIGRQLDVRYRAEMHFSERSKLEGYEIAPDFVGALMEILSNLSDCEKILGRALIKGHVLGEKQESEVDGVRISNVDAKIESGVNESPKFSHAMDLAYILS